MFPKKNNPKPKEEKPKNSKAAPPRSFVPLVKKCGTCSMPKK